MGRSPRPRCDAGFRKDPVQVVADSSVRQIKPGADFLVRKTFGRELRDVKLLRGQRFPHVLGSPAAGFARSAQFLSRAVAPGRSAERIEDVAGLTQRSPRIGGPALAAQPPAIGQEKTSSQERPFLRRRPKALQEELLGIFRRGEQRLAIMQHRLDPRHRHRSRDALDLVDRHHGPPRHCRKKRRLPRNPRDRRTRRPELKAGSAGAKRRRRCS